MKVLFLAAYSELAASSRARVYQFLPLLEKRGIKYKVLCFIPSFLYRLKLNLNIESMPLGLLYYSLIYIIRLFKSFWAVLVADKFDIIFIQKLILPFRLEKVLKLLNRNIIFEFDDAIFVNDENSKGIIGKIKTKFQNEGFKRMLKIAKCCLVENEYNRNIALKYCPYVEKITGPIDTKRYFVRDEKKEGNNLLIGWIGSPYTTKYLYEIKDALKKLSQKYNIILRLIGAKKDFKIEGVNYEIKEWTLKTELAWLQSFNIGIMPLTNDKWTKGKGGYKLLQYMSMGIPAVASLVGVNKKIIKDGVNGFLADSSGEWIKKLSILIEDEILREKIGKRARITIEQDYSLIKATEKLLRIFKNILILPGKLI